MTWPIVQVRSTLKKKPSCHDRSDQVQLVIITRQNNDMTKHTYTVYAKNDIEH